MTAMENTLKDNLQDRGVWVRGLYMVLFGVIMAITQWIVFLIAIVQFLCRLLSGTVNEELRTLGERIGEYLHQIVAFETFHTEERPYPFKPFPGAKTGAHGGRPVQEI
jgi:hypothetical protein